MPTKSGTKSINLPEKRKTMLKSAVKNLGTASKFAPKCLKSQNLSIHNEGIPRETVDCVVIGAGIVGIAVARALALKGREVLVIEAASTFGTCTSSRNSEVIHAGIYYPPKSLKGEAENHKTTFSYNTTVIGGHSEREHLCLHISETKDLETFIGYSHSRPQLILVPKLVINSAGLSAPSLAKRFDGLQHEVIPASYYARGCYFSLSKTSRSPFTQLIYPIPEVGGLGVHVTLDLNGQIKFGPDVEWISDIDDISSFLNKFDYSVDAERARKFYPEIRRYYPNLEDGSLDPGYAGIRPKLSGPTQPPVDFVIQGEETHGVRGLINFFGIESPGLTSSLAIAEYIVSRLLR